MNAARPRFATRLNSFRSHGGRQIPVDDALRQVAAVPGISAVELNYPQHFGAGRDRAVLDAARAARLDITALNLRFDGPRFGLGAFTNPEEADRQAAIDLCVAAVDLASASDIEHVILWMGPDGTDLPFQASYAELWRYEIEGFRAVALRNPAIRVSVEYKPSDPRRVSLIRSMSDALLAAEEVGVPNFGVTLDFCHALMAGEQPAAAAALALRRGRLFGVHLNDGYGPADDGLPVASVHLMPTLELLFELRRAKFDATIYFDTFPERVDPAAECAANIRTVELLLAAIQRIDEDELCRMQSEQRALEAMALVQAALAGNGRG